MKPENRNYALAGVLVEELARSGLRHVCICPGSRSSPLALSFARHPGVKTWVHLDERSAGFFALGLARGLDQPAAIVCTSGTAAANLLPAVIEARYSYTPLLVLTSDRPPELWDWGANQTIHQSRMYGVQAKWAVDFPPAEATPALMRYVRALACRAWATASALPPGPVHINVPFREPLAPESAPEDFSHHLASEGLQAWTGRPDGRPFTEVEMASGSVGREAGEKLALEMRSLEKGIIVCGPQDNLQFPPAVTKAARALGYPVLADPLSQARCGHHDLTQVIDNYDQFLRDEGLARRLTPQVVLRFGATPTSRALGRYMELHSEAKHILVKDKGWPDPSHLASAVVEADPSEFCDGLASGLQGRTPATPWMKEWSAIRNEVRETVDSTVAEMEELFEGRIFAEVKDLLPEGSILYAGNSMPIRDMDGFLGSTDRSIRCMANRGASGIDGVVSAALGAGAATGRPLALVLGDLSLYHDMNGLFAARKYGLKATIIVVNNNGGGVFSFLPQARYPELFEELFGTPHGLEFSPAARMYGLEYARVESWPQFREAISRSLGSPSTTIIEVPGDRSQNVGLHQRVWARVSQVLEVPEKP